MPFSRFDYFKNDQVKREFMAAGVSAGVSAAFASPIGGALFSYEISKPTTFWTFSMIWRIFFCSSISTYTLSLLSQIQNKGFRDLTLGSEGTLKFGSFSDINNYTLNKIHAPIFIGIFGGLLGALFIEC
jgi:H+/Cl- antiporter ClcA